jgi:hypothetical protein
MCIGEEEAAPVTGNSHVSVPGPIADNTPNKHDDALENHKPAPATESHKKEKSVLQAKLTKLAIQIGYAGNFCAQYLNGIYIKQYFVHKCKYFVKNKTVSYKMALLFILMS